MKARIRVTLKNGVLDPQGKAISGALHHLGFHTAAEVRQGKYIEVELTEKDKKAAEKSVDAMCQKLLANTVIENYRFELERLIACHSRESGNLKASCTDRGCRFKIPAFAGMTIRSVFSHQQKSHPRGWLFVLVVSYSFTLAPTPDRSACLWLLSKPSFGRRLPLCRSLP